MDSVEFSILGEPASKANSRRIVKFGNRMASIKSRKAIAYTDAFKLQCPQLKELMTGALRVDIEIHYHSRRPDLDESIILDAMQGLIYDNDRSVKEKHIYWRLDRAEPRARIKVSQIPDPEHSESRWARTVNGDPLRQDQ